MPGSGFTTLSLKPKTLQRLRGYKVAGLSYDDVLNDLMDERPTEDFWRDVRRRLDEGGAVPWREARKTMKNLKR